MRKYSKLKISYVVPIYNEQEDYAAFYHLVNTYSKYSRKVLKHLHFIFVDDHSPIPLKMPTQHALNYTLARIDTNILWNQGGARNLGVHLSRTSKLILTDLDILFDEDGLLELLEAAIPQNIHVFPRISSGQQIHPHFNTFYCSKSTYYKSLGVDEAFCGHYGHEDVFFLDFQKRLGTRIIRSKSIFVSHFEHKNTDKAQHQLVRDPSFTQDLYEAKRRILKDPNRDPFEAHSRLFLNFDWQQVEESITLE